MDTINIAKVPYAIGHFLLGVVATWFTWEYVPLMLNVIENLGIWSGWNTGEYSAIIWFALFMLPIIYMIIIPVWVLFEKEEGR